MKGQYMVAVCDILGFSDLIENNPLEVVVERSLGWFRKALHHSLHKSGFPSEIPTKAAMEMHEHLGVAWFSDTVLLYSLRDDDEAVRQLIATVGWLIFENIVAGRTRIRAGVSYGEAFIDHQNSIFVGKAILEAYRLEQRQQWSGAALTEAATNRIPEGLRSGKFADWWVIPYDVPVKGDLTIPSLAVDWTWGFHGPRWRMAWSPTSEMPADADWLNKPDVCRKFVNTKQFHDAVCRHCR
jgi:hypothetical protein